MPLNAKTDEYVKRIREAADYPATLSKKVLGIIRKKGFDGVEAFPNSEIVFVPEFATAGENEAKGTLPIKVKLQ